MDGNVNVQVPANDAERSRELRRLSIQRCIQSLLHACQCRNANCSLVSCQKMKRVVQHTKGCKRKTNGGCPVCKQLIALCCYHAKHCQENRRNMSLESGRRGTRTVRPGELGNTSPSPEQVTASFPSAYIPAPTTAVSPTRPFRLPTIPPVDVAAARFPQRSRATAPTVCGWLFFEVLPLLRFASSSIQRKLPQRKAAR
ncbi:hypothetical protein JZ751_021473 [Albula glossodonta]|uniref:histone acetyltransferase n=1 Tax=Albula glossodonta TaxID=121402 RepID=A0A8T2NMA4_9TELE|nr:hypothetical protein JZ751_021473 [Albula glossodonta]